MKSWVSHAPKVSVNIMQEGGQVRSVSQYRVNLHKDHREEPRETIERSDGVTPSEQYLKSLCDRSFLSLWSYPGLFRDQGRFDGKGDGKEVCDLLVVFEDHVIIFSDKHIRFDTANGVETGWARWFRKAVLKSAHQVWGAERWIRQFPTL